MVSRYEKNLMRVKAAKEKPKKQVKKEETPKKVEAPKKSKLAE